MALPNPKKNLNCILKDLHKGQETAHLLSTVVKGSKEAKGLIGEVLDTFSKVISALETEEPLKEAGSTESADLKTEISNKKRKGIDGSDQRSGSRRRLGFCVVLLLFLFLFLGNYWLDYENIMN
jgi:hypothetical protein